ncbi:MAG: hypothetical protein SF070_13215 [Gemmatimonadota bacterium]|nr:hypothetical protein [Gemmatimonadota bacterium]
MRALIDSGRHERLELKDFRKTDGQSQELFGVKVYTLEFAGTVQVLARISFNAIAMAQAERLEAFDAVPASANRMAISEALMTGQKNACTGDALRLRGQLMFELKESGWRLSDAKLTVAQDSTDRDPNCSTTSTPSPVPPTASPARAATAGRFVYLDRTYNLHVMNADGSGDRQLTSDGGARGRAQWSPDGEWIAFARTPATGTTAERAIFQIHVMRDDGTELRQVTRSNDYSLDPAWSPDGKQLAYWVRTAASGTNPAKGDVFIHDLSGGPPRHLAEGQWPAWSPDGRQVAFACGRPVSLCVATLGGGVPTVLATGGAPQYPTWSPDGGRIAFSRDSIFVIGSNGGGLRSLGKGGNTSWSPDGRHIAFVDCGEMGGCSLSAMNADGSAASTIAEGWLGIILGDWTK